MSTSREVLSVLSKDDLIGTIMALEDSLAEAATGLMKEGSRQQYCQQIDILSNRLSQAELDLTSIPRLIRWWYGC